MAVPSAWCFLVSCKTKSEFDPRVPGAGVSPQEPQFVQVNMGSIRPEYLKPKAEPYRIGPGDVLEIEIIATDGTKANTLVMPDGMIFYDLAGGVPAAGLKPEELEDRLAAKLKADYPLPEVSVRIAEYHSQSYTILGQIDAPGSFALGQPTTILQAISLAGGLSGFAQDYVDLDRSIALRGNEVIPVDFDALIRRGDMSQNIYLEPGDYIFLAEAAGATVYVLGDVAKATIVPYTARTTFISALAQAGGPNRSAYASGIVLIRGTLKNPTVAAVDFRAVVRGQATDFKLEPGDILWVPTAPWEKLEEYAKLFVRSATTAIVLRSSGVVVENGVRQ